jgi:hypothetical protein
MSEHERDGSEESVYRSLTTDAAIALAPALAVAVDHYLNQPDKPEPPKVELPPGVERD